MNMNDIAARLAALVAGNTNRKELLAALRSVCGNHFDGLRGTPTTPFRACITQPGKSGWLGVIAVDRYGNVSVESEEPEVALADVRADSKARHGKSPNFGDFLVGIAHAAVYAGFAGGPVGAKAVTGFIAASHQH